MKKKIAQNNIGVDGLEMLDGPIIEIHGPNDDDASQRFIVKAMNAIRILAFESGFFAFGLKMAECSDPKQPSPEKAVIWMSRIETNRLYIEEDCSDEN